MGKRPIFWINGNSNEIIVERLLTKPQEAQLEKINVEIAKSVKYFKIRDKSKDYLVKIYIPELRKKIKNQTRLKDFWKGVAVHMKRWANKQVEKASKVAAIKQARINVRYRRKLKDQFNQAVYEKSISNMRGIINRKQNMYGGIITHQLISRFCREKKVSIDNFTLIMKIWMFKHFTPKDASLWGISESERMLIRRLKILKNKGMLERFPNSRLIIYTLSVKGINFVKEYEQAYKDLMASLIVNMKDGKVVRKQRLRRSDTAAVNKPSTGATGK
jgi:hypothetical protein